MRPESVRLTTERALLAVGLGMLLLVGALTVDSHLAQLRASDEFERGRALAKESGASARTGGQGLRARRGATKPARGDVLARLEIPRLDLAAMIQEGEDRRTLERSIGHVEGTALPGEQGNVCLAAHRDTFFRPLKDIRVGDSLTLTTFDGAFTYQVDTLRIVQPEDVSVLRPSREPKLTLISCYPFYYVGNAPKRFIVEATMTTGHRTPEQFEESDAPMPTPPRR